jgi:hypothetical protein
MRIAMTIRTLEPGLLMRWVVMLLVAMLAGCNEQASARFESTPPATSHAKAVGEGASLVSFLRDTYGPAATLAGEWPEKIGDFDYTSRVCLDRATQHHLVDARWVAVCSTNLNHAHGMQGSIAFYVLEAESMTPVAEMRGLESGSHGRPGVVDWLDLGGLGAFRVSSRWQGQGYDITSITLVGSSKGELGEIATWNSSFTFQGTCAESTCPDALEYKVAAEVVKRPIDAGLHDAPLAHLRFHEQGIDCGRPVESTHKVAFDHEAGRYPVPAVLARNACTTSTDVPGVTPP